MIIDKLKQQGKVRKSSGVRMGYGQEDAHESIDPVLWHSSFLFKFRNRNEGAANHYTPNVEEDGLEIGVQRHVTPGPQAGRQVFARSG